MRQTYLTSDNPTVVNRLRKDCREYARQRELEEWFENIHHVRLAWKEDADGKRTVEGVEAVMSKETLTIQGKGDLKGYWLMPMNGIYKPCKNNVEVWRMLRQFEWRPDPLPGHRQLIHVYAIRGHVYRRRQSISFHAGGKLG